MADNLELQLVRAWNRYLEHLAGQHNQKSHANRYGSPAALKANVRRLGKDKEALKRMAGRVRKTRTTGYLGDKKAGHNNLSAKEARKRLIDIAGDEGQLKLLAAKEKAANKAMVDYLNSKSFNPMNTNKDEIKPYLSASKAYNKARRKRHELSISVVKVDDPAEVTGKFTSTFKGKRKERVEAGINHFNSLVSKDVVGENSVGVKADRGKRSFYDLQGNINMSKSSGVATVVHEMGHWLEDRNQRPEVLKKSIAFLEKRTQGEDPQRLSKVYGRGYKPNEIAKVDDFSDAYSGKIYKTHGQTYATEILSMGLQKMFEDPVKFALEDPEYFDFVYETVRGR